jgi:hypothetical protein
MLPGTGRQGGLCRLQGSSQQASGAMRTPFGVDLAPGRDAKNSAEGVSAFSSTPDR